LANSGQFTNEVVTCPPVLSQAQEDMESSPVKTDVLPTVPRSQLANDSTNFHRRQTNKRTNRRTEEHHHRIKPHPSLPIFSLSQLAD